MLLKLSNSRLRNFALLIPTRGWSQLCGVVDSNRRRGLLESWDYMVLAEEGGRGDSYRGRGLVESWDKLDWRYLFWRM